MRTLLWTLALSSFLLISQKAHTGYVLVNEHLYHSDELPSYSASKHYALAVRAFDACKFEESAKQFRILAINFKDCDEAKDAWFFAGVSYYEHCDLDLANSAFSCYLTSQTAPHYFEEAVYYKLCIADRLAEGERIHPIESIKLPKCITARGLALEIYEEVITLMPTSELAANALYKKASLQWAFGLYKEAICSYQMLIRRFPKNEMAPDSYLNMLYIYLAESRIEFQNPDILSFAEITLKKFQQDFPKDERLERGECVVASIKEVFASGLYSIADFYIRTCKPSAATIYYQMVIVKFPCTRSAEMAKLQLQVICPDAIAALNKCKNASDSHEESFEKYDIEDL